MKTPKLNQIETSEALLYIDINELVKAGLILNENFEIPENFHYVHKIDEDKLFFVHITRSGGSFCNLEIHYGFFLEPTDNGENVHIEQEISIYQDEVNQLYFVCPILGAEKPCTKLYMRYDFPIFGSKEGLNISDARV